MTGEQLNPGGECPPSRFDQEKGAESPPSLEPVLRAFRSPRDFRRAPGRKLRLLAAFAATGALAALCVLAVGVFLGDAPEASPWDVADRFVTCLELGEEPDPTSDDARMGYLLAYDMFTDGLQEEVVWIDFLQGWVRLSREHGYVMSSLCRTQRAYRRGDRRKRTFVYDLSLGRLDQAHGDMTRFRLRLELKKIGDGYGIRSYELVPIGPHER